MLHRILEQMGDLILFAMISLVFGVIKVFAAPSVDCWKCNIGTILISVVIGTISGALALESGFGDYTAITVSSLCSLLSRDILAAILNNRKNIGMLVRRAMQNLVDKYTR
jgi:hypothetical protein